MRLNLAHSHPLKTVQPPGSLNQDTQNHNYKHGRVRGELLHGAIGRIITVQKISTFERIRQVSVEIVLDIHSGSAKFHPITMCSEE